MRNSGQIFNVYPSYAGLSFDKLRTSGKNGLVLSVVEVLDGYIAMQT